MATVNCNHNKGFTLLSQEDRKMLGIKEGGDLAYAYICKYLCGFYMNFNPEEHPDEGVSYLDKPKDGLKEHKLSEEGKY